MSHHTIIVIPMADTADANTATGEGTFNVCLADPAAPTVSTHCWASWNFDATGDDKAAILASLPASAQVFDAGETPEQVLTTTGLVRLDTGEEV